MAACSAWCGGAHPEIRQVRPSSWGTRRIPRKATDAVSSRAMTCGMDLMMYTWKYGVVWCPLWIVVSTQSKLLALISVRQG